VLEEHSSLGSSSGSSSESQTLLFEQHRPLMLSIAYRMLGTAADAEDVLHDAYLRWHSVDADTVQYPKAFLSQIVTRLCLDRLKSARAEREVYHGVWLPEPVLTGVSGEDSKMESLSMALLVVLESLSPAERAVFILRDVFDYEYGEVAEILGKDESACRQLLHRARQHIAERRPRYHASQEAHNTLLTRFVGAISEGNLEALTSLLTEDAVIFSDGGGKVHAAPKPVQGRDKMVKALTGGIRLVPPPIDAKIEVINGYAGIVVYSAGKPHSVVTIELAEDGQKIRAVRLVLNPDKLRLARID
jgi:RNA polymerase sigma-70 factor, ECF subfamily